MSLVPSSLPSIVRRLSQLLTERVTADSLSAVQKCLESPADQLPAVTSHHPVVTLSMSVLYCTVLYCTVLYCTVPLYCACIVFVYVLYIGHSSGGRALTA